MTSIVSQWLRTGAEPDEQPKAKNIYYIARQIEADETALLTECYRLRFEYFVEERRWTIPSGSAGFLERDRYDEFAHHLAVCDGEKAIAYMRLLPWSPTGFMLNHEFRCLLPHAFQFPPANSGEISRLVVAKGMSASESTAALELLFKLFYHCARDRGFQHFFIVSESKWLRACRCRFGLGFRPLGPAKVFPDGTRTVAAYASLRDLEGSMQEHSIEKFRWYSSLHPIEVETT